MKVREEEGRGQFKADGREKLNFQRLGKVGGAKTCVFCIGFNTGH